VVEAPAAADRTVHEKTFAAGHRPHRHWRWIVTHREQHLRGLYDATEEHLRFGIGVVKLPGQPAVPIIQIHYRDWTREQLEVIRESFEEGLILVSQERVDRTVDLHIATWPQVAIQA
jgi:hypothetical protein